MINKPPANAGDPGSILGHKDPLEKEIATHSRILAWKAPQTEEPGGRQSAGRRELDTTEAARVAKVKGWHFLNEVLNRLCFESLSQAALWETPAAMLSAAFEGSTRQVSTLSHQQPAETGAS